MANELTIYQSVIDDVKGIISSGMESAYNAASRAKVLTYWNVGRRIVEQEQNGNQRAEYGAAMMDALARELTKEYGKSYSKRNLQYFRKFYQCFPDIEIVNACVHNLTWTHFRSLLRVSDEDARAWYMNEAAHENWNVRTLDRNIGTQRYSNGKPKKFVSRQDRLIRELCPLANKRSAHEKNTEKIREQTGQTDPRALPLGRQEICA